MDGLRRGGISIHWIVTVPLATWLLLDHVHVAVHVIPDLCVE
jgi:hypothetical protein